MTAAPGIKTTARRIGAQVGAIALTLTLASCASDSDDAAQEPGGQTAASQTVFESERHAYELHLPARWQVTEYGGAWTSIAQVTPPGDVPGEDVASSLDGTGWLVVNSMPIPEKLSPSDWIARLDQQVKSTLGKDCPLTTSADVLAGEPATMGSHQCDGKTVVGRTLAHAGRGYYFTIGYPTDDTSTMSTLNDIVASIRFVDQ